MLTHILLVNMVAIPKEMYQNVSQKKFTGAVSPAALSDKSVLLGVILHFYGYQRRFVVQALWLWYMVIESKNSSWKEVVWR